VIGERRLRRMVRAAPLSLALSLLPASAAGAPALHVIPFPGTPDAAPLSHVVLSSLHRSEVRSVFVKGSASGRHHGHLVSLPDDAGTAFLPASPFTPGERVTVTAGLSSPAAGTASGDPGATTIQFSFTVALPAASGNARAQPASNSSADARIPAPGSTAPVQSFHSAPALHPPPVTMTSDSDAVSGDIFLTPTHAQQNGVMILDPRGHLMWFHHTAGYAANLQVQRYRSHRVLTWWQGPSFGNGEGVIMSSSYRTLKVLHAGEGYAADVHEFTLTPQGTAFIDVSVPVKADLSSIGGTTHGNLWDYEIQELDIRTGQLLWEWHALGHVPVSASYKGQPQGWPPYDYFHLNSIQQLPSGNLLVCARNTWGVYEIDKQTGRVIWTLGGRYSNFSLGPGAGFEWQHDARLHGSTLSLFDDAADPQKERQSSAKVLRLDTQTMTASLGRRYTHSPPVLAAAAGGTQILPDHNVVVGWGNQGAFSEYAAGGRQIFNASLPLGQYSYRAYRFPWTGHPGTRPALALSKPANGRMKIYVSWNGATAVSAWRVRGGPRPGAFRALARARRTGFETTIVLSNPPRHLAVQALDGQGNVIGTSRVRSR
jgi:Arylsulfotransferase (ASST)